MLAVRTGKRRPPPPWWGRAVSLSELASLEKRGEGVTLSVNTPVARPARPTPSPSFSKLASSLRERALPHQGGGGRRFRANYLAPWFTRRPVPRPCRP